MKEIIYQRKFELVDLVSHFQKKRKEEFYKDTSNESLHNPLQVNNKMMINFLNKTHKIVEPKNVYYDSEV